MKDEQTNGLFILLAFSSFILCFGLDPHGPGR
jgi:hypothetical protein